MIRKNTERKHSVFLDFIDNTSFARIFVLWIGLVFLFSIIYYTITITTGSEYLSSAEGNRITGFVDYIYYSFITATSTGYGDIVPEGTFMRSLAIFNVVLGMMMMAIITSKIVSMKQEKLLENIYHISFSDNVNRILLSLNVFRGEANNLIESLENDEIDKKNLFAFRITLSSLRHHLYEVKELVDGNHFKGNKKHIQLEQMISGLRQVYDKMERIIKLLNDKNFEFKNTVFLEEFYKIANIGDSVLSDIKKDFPIFTAKIGEAKASVKEIRRNIMTFKITDNSNDIEINISPEIVPES